MKPELFNAILFVVLAVIFMYALNSKRKRKKKTRDYINQYGMEAYIYRTAFRTVIFIAVLLIITKFIYR
jgi:hypothetical protein